MRTSNPVLRGDVLRSAPWGYGETRAMTVDGAVNKTFLLLAILVVAAAYTWSLAFNGADVSIWMTGGIIGGLVLAIATTFKMEWSPYTAPLYAVCEGLALGGISAVFEARYPGIAMRAVAGTFSVLAVMLIAYRSGLVRPTDRFRAGVIAATGGVMLFYLVTMVLSLFHVSMPFLYNASPLGIGLNVLIAGIAALNLVLDFGFIEQGAQSRAPQYFEWYGAFGLLVTLVWLYLEILRLLARLQSNRD